MKAIHLVLALAAVAACGKQNDVATLHEEAVTLAKFYGKKVDALDERVNAIMKLGGEKTPDGKPKIAMDAPGAVDAARHLQEAREEIDKLKVILGPGKDAVQAQADAAAKQGNVAALRKLVADTREEIDSSLTIITTDIDTIESWLAYYDNKLLAGNTGAGAQPSSETPAPAEPAAPEAQGSAAQQGSASPAQPNAQAGSAAAQPKK